MATPADDDDLPEDNAAQSQSPISLAAQVLFHRESRDVCLLDPFLALYLLPYSISYLPSIILPSLIFLISFFSPLHLLHFPSLTSQPLSSIPHPPSLTFRPSPSVPHPPSLTLHSSPSIPHPPSLTLHPSPSTPHPPFLTLHSSPSIPHPPSLALL